MKKNYLFLTLLIFGIILFSNQKIKAQSGLQYELLQANLDQIIGSIKDDGTVVIPEIEIRNEVITVAPPNSTKTTYFEDKDGDGYTSGKTIEDFPGLDIPGYKEIMFLDIGSIVKNTVTGLSSFIFDCDDNNTNIIRGMFYYEDKDEDGYITNSPPITACTKPDGYTSEENIKGIDCDDNTFNSEKPTTTYYLDSDGDGYPSSFGEYCEKPVGYKSAAELESTERDCNDNNKDVWEQLWYYQDIDGDGYHGFSGFTCVGAPGPTRDAVVKSILDIGLINWETLGPDCDDNNVLIGLYQPIKFLKPIIRSITIEGCSIDDVGNETIPAINTSVEFITTSEAVLREAGARIAEGFCSIVLVRYQDQVYPANSNGSIRFRRNFIAKDNFDNVAYFSQNYIIRDITKPTISPLDDITAENDTGKCGAAKENVLVSPYVFDNCTLVGDLVITNNAPDFLEVGEHSVEWSVKDIAGNIQKAVQKVTIKDTEPPIVRTKNITVALGPKGDVFVPFSSVDNGSSDNCGITSFNLNWKFSCNSLGENTVTLSRRDAAGNTSSADAIITVIDNTPPIWTTTMPDMTASCDFIPAPLAPVAVDNCDSEPEVFWLESSDQDPNPNNIGHYNYTITWTWIARDASGNSSIDLIQKVNVSDTGAPIIEAVKPIEASCSKIPDPITPGVKDNCDPNPLITFSESSDQNPDNSTAGHYNYTITRKWTAKDVSGNQSERTQLVNVVDDRGPEWVSLKSSMDITLYCGDESELSNAQSLLPVALDNCDQNPTITKTNGLFVPGLLPGQGSYTNTFTATDASGNGTSEFRQVISILPLSIDASESSTPVQLGTTATLKATVSPIVAGIATTFVLYNENGIIVDEIKSFTDNSGLATTTVNDLVLGVYKIVATVGTGCSESTAYLPVFDPNGSFVTGAGWIQSPQGAVVDQPEIEGKANFGFVSKYKKGSNQVDGKTDFRFNAADIDFKSSFHESGSLVISGKRATYRGDGTVNGVSGYKFMLVAIDGNWNNGNDPDQFRIKISDSNGVIYDNQLGSDENSESSTVIGGGSIVIKATKKDNTKREIDLEGNELSIESREPNMELAINVRAYPNPVTDGILTLDFGHYSARHIHTTAIVDMTGKTIAVSYHDVLDQNTIELDVSMLKQGMYLIQVHGEDFFKVVKIIKK
jgi:hypothetical protein